MEEPGPGGVRERGFPGGDPALLEIRSLLEAEDYGEVEEMLEGFEASRRDKIAAILRSEQGGGSGSRRAERERAARAEPEERSSLQLAVVAVGQPRSPLLSMKSGGDVTSMLAHWEAKDQGGMAQAVKEMVGGGRNLLHVAAAARVGVVAKALGGLLSISDPNLGREVAAMLVARDCAGRTPFFVALELGNLPAGLAILEQVDILAERLAGSSAAAGDVGPLPGSTCVPGLVELALSSPDLEGTPPLHALLGLSPQAGSYEAGEGPEVAKRLISLMVSRSSLRKAKDGRGRTALEAFAVSGSVEREALAVRDAKRKPG